MATAVKKQPEISELFSKLIQKNTLQHAYIFEGVAGAGKFEMAIWVAQGLFCQQPADDGSPCLSCNQCLRIQQAGHPDVSILEPDGASIKVGQVRAIKDEFAKSGMESRQKVLIVKQMDKMTTSAANSLLKFIEEPEGEITILLLTSEVQQLLPTIVSRSQIIHFPVRDIHTRIEDIMAKDVPSHAATLLAYLTQDTDEALDIYEDEQFSKIAEMVWQWFLLLNKKDEQAFIYVQTTVMPLVDNRETSSLILDLLILIYRDLMAVCFEQERVLAFSKQEKELKQFATRTMQNELTQNLTALLDGKKKLNRYVAAQGVFEQIALKVIKK
jgi:DNA polymerase-3 subunit delta'